ncbi:Coiled-coil domain-containing protein 49 [Gryllus bimaculatus]|nr:Coiled-coil domain-containing protein 49 [Gryllus bimaculatus]
MGGGDLNLKKSWHPSTMRNMEKVWKAEQKHDQEKKRIAELQREIQEEKAREDMQKYAEDQGVIEKKSGDVKLDWMYKGPGSSVDHEEYLLGKAIDKSFEQLQRSQQQTAISVPGRTDSTCLPGSIFAGTGEQVDVARKLQEDPLLAIRKKELQTRSEILKNPVKLKQLKEMMKTQKSKKSHGKHKKEKKKKKSKKRSKRSSSSDDSDSDLDAKLLAKYQKLKQKLGDNALEALQKSPDNEDRKKHKKRTSSTSESEEEIPSKKPHKSYGLLLPPGAKVNRTLSPKPSTEESRTRDDKSKAPTPQTPQIPRKQKLSDEEKERRRQEMLSNAAWREKERESNVARYREADRKEKSQKQKEFSDDFFRQHLSQAHAQSSVASRIKSNINNIQRSGGSMDKNFARR